MYITVRMVFYISIVGFKYIITKDNGIASEIVARLAKKPMQCNKGRNVIYIFSFYIKIKNWFIWLFFSIDFIRQLLCIGQAKFRILPHLSFIGSIQHTLSWKNHSAFHASCKAATNVSDTRNKHLPFLHGWKLYPAIKSGIISADKICTVFSCKNIFETLKLRFLCCVAHLIVFYRLPLSQV